MARFKNLKKKKKKIEKLKDEKDFSFLVYMSNMNLFFLVEKKIR